MGKRTFEDVKKYVECGATTEVVFEKSNGDRTPYITGKAVE